MRLAGDGDVDINNNNNDDDRWRRGGEIRAGACTTTPTMWIDGS
jgi:hypothetical protein